MGIDAGYGIGSLKPGVCTSTTRPAAPFVGQMIYETDTKLQKVWLGTTWSSGYLHTATISVDYLIIAGGGSGAANAGQANGGGGAGGYRSETSTITNGTTYTVTVGGGGASVTSGNNGNKGSNSSFNSISATGGGEVAHVNPIFMKRLMRIGQSHIFWPALCRRIISLAITIPLDPCGKF